METGFYFDDLTEFQKDILQKSIKNFPNETKKFLKKCQKGLLKVVSLSDTSSIKKYGLLNYIEDIDQDTKVDYKKIAQEKLKELCQEEKTITLNCIADYNMRIGVITTINNEK